MTATHPPLSPENQMVLDELERAEGSIPRYDEKMPLPPPAAPEARAPRLFPCKYGCTDAGPFTNPGQLGQHYSESHPEHKKANANAEKVTCTCGRTVTRSSWRYHMDHMHPDVPRSEWKSYEAKTNMPGEKTESDRVPCPRCSTTLKDRDSLGKHLNRVHHISIKDLAVIEPEPEDDQPVTMDDIVVGLVELRWPHHVPTPKIREMFAWREHTERFLNG
jgi:hypothetical protein